MGYWPVQGNASHQRVSLVSMGSKDYVEFRVLYKIA